MILSECGFMEFPYVVPRWLKSSAELGYGRSSAMSCLSDVKMLNKISEITIRSAQKQVDPPLMVPDDGFMLPVRVVPGGLNFYRSGTRDRIEPLNTSANNPLGLNMEEQRRDAIRSAFYVDQLISGQGPAMTATEIIAKTEEKNRILAPITGRLTAELLQPLINRVYALLGRQGVLPQPPEFMQGDDIDIEYVSPLAKAQKLTDLQSMLRGFEVMMQVAEIAPVMDYLDSDKLVQYLVEVTGIPARVIRSDQEVARIRDEQAEEAEKQEAKQDQMMEAQQAQQVAPLIKAVGDTE